MRVRHKGKSEEFVRAERAMVIGEISKGNSSHVHWACPALCPSRSVLRVHIPRNRNDRRAKPLMTNKSDGPKGHGKGIITV